MRHPPLHLTVAATLLLLVLAPFFATAEDDASEKKKKPKHDTVLLSPYDDKDVGEDASKSVEAQIGVLDDEELNAYINAIGLKLLRAIPRRTFDYKFRVVDQVEPNAFALPGGYIFVSRGLLTLTNNEDELACVIGHEITHVAKRHAAAQQGVQRGQFPLLGPWMRAGRMAAYSRDLERSADRGGQILCAAAGYDPQAMATFLDSLTESEKLRTGFSRNASFLDTHPSSGKRSTIARIQASELRWKRDPAIGDPRESLLREIDGLPVGQRPEAGLFRGDVFMHPDLDFKLRFPRNWRKANTNTTVGAQAPRGDAFVFLMGDVPPGDPQEVAQQWLDDGKAEGSELQGSEPFTVGRTRAWRLELAAIGPVRARSYVTFIPHGGSTFRVTGAGISKKGLDRTQATTRSFHRLSDEDRSTLEATKLRLVVAEPGENVAALCKRTDNVWNIAATAVHNGYSTSHRFKGGELVKIAQTEPYTPKPRVEPGAEEDAR